MQVDGEQCTAEERHLARDWMVAHVMGDATFFSFTYGGAPSGGLLPAWARREKRERLDRVRTQHEVTYTDCETGLRVRCVAVAYRDFPVVEWTVHLKNTGHRDTSIVEALQAVNMAIPRATLGPKPCLHYQVGSPSSAEDYAPLTAELAPGRVKRIATSGGRPCNAHMPFFNLEGADRGLIVAVGWGGQWAAEFGCDRGGNTRIVAGQERTHFVLHPGEEVRTPLIALLFYRGDRTRSQNVWRRWMLAHSMPRPGGKLPPPLAQALAWLYFAPWGTSNSEASRVFIDAYKARKIPIDSWWTDAGWYDCDAAIPTWGYSSWVHTGTWRVDRRRFPKGLREVNDHAHKNGLKTVVWFELERVRLESWLAKTHPEWLLAPPRKDPAFKHTRLLDYGNPAARRWAVNQVSRIIAREHIDVYREDFNFDPLAFWRAKEARNRQGITEIRHVVGHLAYWDELQRRHPRLLINVCASGGKRNELEALRRAVPLWRSDYIAGVSLEEANTARLAASQSITWGIASWIPYFGTGINTAIDPYRFRSCMSPSLAFDFDPRREDLDADLWRRLTEQFKKVASCFFGDYYPLTPYSLANDVWMAWQFDCPEKGEGMVQAFRRAKCPQTTVRFRLRGLRPDATYEVVDLDGGRPHRLSGLTLMKTGLKVESSPAPAAMVLTYSRPTGVTAKSMKRGSVDDNGDENG